MSHHFLLHFAIGMGSYDHHTKHLGVFSGASIKPFFQKVPPPPFEFIYFFFQRGDPYEKSVFFEVHKHSLIFCVVVIGTHTNWKMQ